MGDEAETWQVYDLKQALRFALDWIDAVPKEVVDRLPAMPGFDRDFAETILASDGTYEPDKRLCSYAERIALAETGSPPMR